MNVTAPKATFDDVNLILKLYEDRAGARRV
jgi:hypothetical protein